MRNIDEIIKKLNSYNSNVIHVNVHLISKKNWFERKQYDYEATKNTTRPTDNFEERPLVFVESNIEFHIFINTEIKYIDEFLNDMDFLIDKYRSKNPDVFRIKESLDSADTKQRRLLNIVKNINFTENID